MNVAPELLSSRKRSSLMQALAVCGWSAMTLGIIGAATARADVSGQQVFQQNCAVCHQLAPNANGAGPSLFDIYGRKAASRNFTYSDALKAVGKNGLTWDDATLRKWVQKPMELVPGTTMGFIGLTYEEDVAAVVAFLKNGGKDSP